MKKNINNVLLIILLIFIEGCNLQDKGLNTNNSVKIGTQEWMTENLSISTFRNGDTISEAKTEEEWIRAGEEKKPAFCYFHLNPDFGEKYGKLYNWFAVNDLRGLSPKGWHIPSEKEWNQLFDELGGKEIAANKLKATTGWINYHNENGNGNNFSGFTALPSGDYSSNGSNSTNGEYGHWWCSTESNEQTAFSIAMNNIESRIFTPDCGKHCGCAVRCIKD
jgi:uncharacterized protein (TIGR02145 family)